MLLQQSVDKDIAAAHLSEEDALRGVVEKVNIAPRDKVVTPKDVS